MCDSVMKLCYLRNKQLNPWRLTLTAQMLLRFFLNLRSLSLAAKVMTKAFDMCRPKREAKL